MNTDLAYQPLLTCWFDPTVKPLWYNSTEAFDNQLRDDFLITYHAAKNRELVHWEETASGALALVILLDQIPLNIFRGKAECFATEGLALEAAANAIKHKFDDSLDDEQRAFMYLPYMHSEKISDQDKAVALFEAAGLNGNLEYAQHHRNIIKQFGRFPHRNAILGRQSTSDETDYLTSANAFLG
jgi:uncharacterized protein (DUF924 family)